MNRLEAAAFLTQLLVTELRDRGIWARSSRKDNEDGYRIKLPRPTVHTGRAVRVGFVEHTGSFPSGMTTIPEASIREQVARLVENILDAERTSMKDDAAW